MKQIILESGDIRLNTLRHVFGIDKYKRIEENLSTLTSKLREKIRLFEAITYDIESENKILDQKKQEIENLKIKQKNTIKDYHQASEFKTIKEKALEEIQEIINPVNPYNYHYLMILLNR